MKITCLIPTTGEPLHKPFLDQAYRLIDRQTRKPDDVVTISSPENVTNNFRKGFEIIKTGIIACWEHDDYYHPDYLKWVEDNWDDQYDLLGIGQTIYYSLPHKKYWRKLHPHSSMFQITVKAGIKGIQYPDNNFLDLALCKQLKCKILNTFTHNIGIKHGIGRTAGVGHKDAFWTARNDLISDTTGEFLRSVTMYDKFYLDFQK